MGKFQTIVVDPPWRYRVDMGKPAKPHGRRWAEDVYPTMSNIEIMALPINSLAAENCHLYLWVTNPRLYGERQNVKPQITPHDIIEAWGFTYKTCLTWVKTQIGLGSYFRGRTEHVLFAVRGDLRIEPSNRKANTIITEEDGVAFIAPRGAGGHSSKPEAFYDMIQAISPPPYLEVFARRQRLGWETWGNESFMPEEAQQ